MDLKSLSYKRDAQAIDSYCMSCFGNTGKFDDTVLAETPLY